MKEVLVVTASEETQLSLTEILKNNCRLTICSSADECLERLQIRRPDAWILDLRLPGTTGFDLLRSAQIYRPPVLILLTTFCNQDVLAMAEQLGVTAILLKPLCAESVLAALRR